MLSARSEIWGAGRDPQKPHPRPLPRQRAPALRVGIAAQQRELDGVEILARHQVHRHQLVKIWHSNGDGAAVGRLLLNRQQQPPTFHERQVLENEADVEGADRVIRELSQR